MVYLKIYIKYDYWTTSTVLLLFLKKNIFFSHYALLSLLTFSSPIPLPPTLWSYNSAFLCVSEWLLPRVAVSLVSTFPHNDGKLSRASILLLTAPAVWGPRSQEFHNQSLARLWQSKVKTKVSRMSQSLQQAACKAILSLKYKPLESWCINFFCHHNMETF